MKKTCGIWKCVCFFTITSALILSSFGNIYAQSVSVTRGKAFRQSNEVEPPVVSQQSDSPGVKTESAAANFYVAPNGTPSGNGSISQPWDIVTAINQPSSVHPGDTIWLRGGTYLGPLIARLNGTPTSPIIVRQYPGERAIVDGGSFINAAFAVEGSYAWYWGFEIKVSNTVRVYSTVPTSQSRADAVYVIGHDVKLINLIVHDGLDGIGLWEPATNAEVYGCLVYNNGVIAPNRGHGHGIYIQNNVGIKQIRESIIFNNYGFGTHAYGEGGGVVGIVFDGIMSFNNGSPSSYVGNPAGYPTNHRTTNLFVGTTTNPADNITIKNGNFYHQTGTDVEFSNVGLGYTSGNNLTVEVSDNYIAGGHQSFMLHDWLYGIVRGNTFYGTETLAGARGVNTANYIWNNNTYYDGSPQTDGMGHPFYFNYATARDGGLMLPYSDPGPTTGYGWRQWTGFDPNSTYQVGRPTGLRVVVRPNQYEQGRANIAVYNWGLQNSVSVNLTNSGLTPGSGYEIRDAQNYYGAPVASGVYNGSPVTIPMTGLTVVQPIGTSNVVTHTAPEFAAFILVPTTAPSQPDANPPSAQILSPRRNAMVSGVVPIQVSAADDVGINRIEFYVDTQLLGTDSVGPFSMNWDTASYSEGVHVLTVRAFDAAGNQGMATEKVKVHNTGPGDSTPPTVGLSAPTGGANVTGTINVNANASDNVGVAGVQFKLDGANLGAEDTSAPYSVSWNSIGASNGPHTLSATARDAAGNSATSAGVNVTVSNGTQPGNVITVNPAVTYQTMRGWEAVARMLNDNYPTTYLNWQPAVLNGAMDLGINRVRVEIESGMENPVNYWAQYLAGQLTLQQSLTHRYEIINDNADPSVTNPLGYQFQWFDFKMAATVLPLRQRLAAQGEQLYVSVCYVDFGSSTFEHKSNPAEYAEFVLAVYQHMQLVFGFVPDAWEVVLEPDAGAASWTPQQVADAVVATQNRLLAAGFTPNFVLPSTLDGWNSINWYNDIKLRNPAAVQYVSEVAYHRYGAIDNTQLAALRDRVQLDGKSTFMSEWIGADYTTLHTDLKVGNNSSWAQFVLASNIANGDNGAHLFMIDPATGAVTWGSRTKFLRQYFKFIRRGAVRIGGTSNQATLDPLAFINTNGKYVVVVKADAGQSFDVLGLPAGIYGIKYTTASQYDIDLPDQTITAGGTVSTSIPAVGVITIYRR